MNEYMSIAALASAALTFLWIGYAISTIRKNPLYWGKPLAILISFGLCICMVVALRDGYGFREDSIIAFDGWQSGLFSLIGVSILLIGLIALLSKKFSRKSMFITVFGLFLFKLVMMETIRFTSFLGEIL